MRKLAGCLEISATKKLTVALPSGATICKLPLADLSGYTLPAWGLLCRYTSDTDTAPDIRRVQLMPDGKLVNNSGIACNIGHTISIELKVITNT